MSASEAARLMRELHTAPESRDMHDTLVKLAGDRVRKRKDRVDLAQSEWLDAVACHQRACEARQAYIDAHPDPQQAIFS